MDELTLFNEILAEVGDGENGLTAAECLTGILVALNVTFHEVAPAHIFPFVMAVAEQRSYDILDRVRQSRGIETTGTEV